MRTITARLSYANVMSTLAVFMALGGTAAAVTLPRNSVASKHIKAGAVKSSDIKNAAVAGADVKDGAITGADVADGSLSGADVGDGSLGAADLGNGAVGAAALADGGVGGAELAGGAVTSDKIADGGVTGADVEESSLGTVPDASLLDGIDSTALSRSGGRVLSDTFTEADSLGLTVPGYGTFVLFCDDNDTPATAGDDRVTYGYSHELGTGAFNGMRAYFSNAPTTATPEIYLFNRDATDTFATIADKDDRVQVEQYLRNRDGSKVIRVSAWGFEDSTSTVNCMGMIETQILR